MEFGYSAVAQTPTYPAPNAPGHNLERLVSSAIPRKAPRAGRFMLYCYQRLGELLKCDSLGQGPARPGKSKGLRVAVRSGQARIGNSPSTKATSYLVASSLARKHLLFTDNSLKG